MSVAQNHYESSYFIVCFTLSTTVFPLELSLRVKLTFIECYVFIYFCFTELLNLSKHHECEVVQPVIGGVVSSADHRVGVLTHC